MKIRKCIDYSAMFVELDQLMALALPQVRLYCEIGRLVGSRMEKGAAVAAAEYLQSQYPEASGFSPRNVRRMRDFYRMYQDLPLFMEETLCLNWTQNVVIMEAELSMIERAWYLHACAMYGWSKLELQRKIKSNAHLEVCLDQGPQTCYNNHNSEQEMRILQNDENTFYLLRQYMQESNGRICNERYCVESREGERLSYCFCSNQYRGDWKPNLSSCTAQVNRAWDKMRQALCSSINQSGLRRVRSPDWHGQSEFPQYVSHLWWGLQRQNVHVV